MFRRHSGRRHTNIVFVIFRLCLSLIILAILAGGLYSAYKHFSGLDPLKVDPFVTISGIMTENKDIGEIINKIPGFRKILDVGNLKMDKENRGLKLDNLTSNIQPQDQVSNLQHPTSRSFALSFALISDSHSDNLYLRKALAQIKKDYPAIKFIIGLGDYTEVGTLDELKNAKKELDNTGIRYFLIPGDHDLWDGRNRFLKPTTNFNQVFGPTYQVFSEGNFLFILLYNSDNYLGLNGVQLDWLSGQLEKAKQSSGIYVFLHEPLYHPSSDHIMGRVESNLKEQAQNIVHKLKEGGVKKIFAGDIHFFSEYQEPETGLSMVTVGAITSERNTQAPRFTLVKVFEDGTTKLEDVEIR